MVIAADFLTRRGAVNFFKYFLLFQLYRHAKNMEKFQASQLWYRLHYHFYNLNLSIGGKNSNFSNQVSDSHLHLQPSL